MTTKNTAPTAESVEKPKEMVRETVNVRHKFTDAEKIALGENLAASMSEKEGVESDFSAVKADFKARIEGKDASIQQHLTKLRNGFEMRNTLVEITFNEPEKGKKTLRDANSGAELGVEEMSPADYERPLFRKAPDGKEVPAVTSAEPTVTEATDEDGDPVEHVSGEGSEGTTSLGNVLGQATAETEQPKVPLRPLATYSEENVLRAHFRKEAKKVGWPETAIDLLDTQASTLPMEALRALLANHVIETHVVK